MRCVIDDLKIGDRCNFEYEINATKKGNFAKLVDYEVLEGVSVDSLKANFAATGAYAIVEISPLDENKDVSVTAYSEKQMNMYVILYMMQHLQAHRRKVPAD